MNRKGKGETGITLSKDPIKLERDAKLGHALPLTTLPSNC